MTTAFSVTVTTAATPDQVWNVLRDWSRAPEWMQGVQELSGPAQPTAGSMLTITSRGKQRTSTVVVADPGRELTLRSVQGGVTADYQYRIARKGDGSEVSLTADVRLRGVFILIGAGIRRAIRGFDGKQLDELKELLDAEAKPQL